MDLFEALNSYCSEHLNETNDWYIWGIDVSKIPINIKFPKGNQYIQNIYLKEELHKAWKSEPDTKKKGEIIKYYIKDWGGILRNSENSMNTYMNSTPDSLMDFGKNGIASWSKALVIHNPQKHAIFDARVSTSLNCLQILFDTKDKVLYPLLSSRNKTIKEGQGIIKQISRQKNWGIINKSTFYIDYLKLLEKVANARETNISTVEMLLFAKAETLVCKLKLT